MTNAPGPRNHEGAASGARGEPGPPGARCRVCHRELGPHPGTRCENCGAAIGPLDPCPCCRAEAGASPHAELRYTCDVCGGPRVPRLDRTITYRGREAALLRKADAARKASAVWKAAAIVDGLLLPVAILFFAALLLIFGASAALVIAALMVVGPLAAFLAFAIGRSSARSNEIGPAVDAAWLAVATDIAQQTRGLTAEGLAERMGIEEAQAEELMALLDVNDALGPRVRIDPSATAPATLHSPAAQPGLTEIASEEEAALADEAALRSRARHEP